jgi:hypothetical protein
MRQPPHKAKKIHQFPVVDVRIEVNTQGNQVLWSVRVGATRCQGFAKSRLEAMQKATLAVETVANIAKHSTADNIVPIMPVEKE